MVILLHLLEGRPRGHLHHVEKLIFIVVNRLLMRDLQPRRQRCHLKLRILFVGFRLVGLQLDFDRLEEAPVRVVLLLELGHSQFYQPVLVFLHIN